MAQPNDLSRSLTPFLQGNTLVVVIELSLTSWLVGGLVPGLERQPLKKLEPDETGLLRLLRRWKEEAVKSGCTIERVVVAYEAGRDGFWLARWLRTHEIEAYVVNSSSVAVSREHRRAKTDRLDTAMLLRVFMGWLRGERGHCGMVAVPTLDEEDAKRPHRERENLVGERTRIINRMKAALIRLGIRGFKPELRKASVKLELLRTPEELPIPPNTLDEIGATSPGSPSYATRSRQSNRTAWDVWSTRQPPAQARWFDCWPASSELASKQRTCWYRKFSREIYAIVGPSPATQGSPVRQMKAAPSDARRVSPNRATPEFAAV